MNIRVRLFSMARELAKISELELNMNDGAQAHDIYKYLAGYNDAFLDYAGAFRLAVNDEYVDADRRLQEGDEVAVIPPVSGG
jgi:molybdopterin converting factor subunit 1